MDHIEKGHCKAITPEKLHAQRAELTANFLHGRKAIEAASSLHAIRANEGEVMDEQGAPDVLMEQDLYNDEGDTASSFRPLEPEPRAETKGKARDVTNWEEWPELGKGIDKLKVEDSHSSSSDEKPKVFHKPSAQGVKFPLEARRIDNPRQAGIPVEERCTFKDAAGNIIFDPYDPTADCSQFKNYDNKYKCYVPVCG